MENKKILIMGVSGTGKSLIGKSIADALGIAFVDGDDFHPVANIQKMQDGIPLTDMDRYGWLQVLNQQIYHHDSLVLACSALKPEYREILSKSNQDLIIVYLQGSFVTILDRFQKRQGHFFKGERMLKNQFDTLVEPSIDEAIFIDIDQDVEHIVSQAIIEIDKWHWKQCGLSPVRWS